MIAAVAMLGLTVISVGVSFANYWFTFGLWPKSWLSFVLCATVQMVISATMVAIYKDIKQ